MYRSIRFKSVTIIVAAIGIMSGSGAVRAAGPVEFTLENGLRVRLVPSERDKRIAVVLGVRAGFVVEPKSQPHLAHVVEHLVVFDVKDAQLRKTAAEWFRKGKANAETLADAMYFDLYPEAEELETALRIQAARLSAVEFDKETLAREIPQTLAEIEAVEKNERASTIKFGLPAWAQAAFHGQKETPIKAITKKISLEQAARFHARTFRPDQAMLFVLGPIDAEKVRKQVEAAFGGIAKPADRPPPRPELKSGPASAAWDVDSHNLFIAWPVPDAGHADHPALTLAAAILNFRLATDADLRPHVRLLIAGNDIEGVFLINVHLKNDVDADKVKQRILELVAEAAGAEGIKEGALPAARLANAQPINVSGPNGELQRMLKTLAWGDCNAYLKRLEGIKADAVRAAIAQHLDEKNASIVVLKPIAK